MPDAKFPLCLLQRTIVFRLDAGHIQTIPGQCTEHRVHIDCDTAFAGIVREKSDALLSKYAWLNDIGHFRVSPLAVVVGLRVNRIYKLRILNHPGMACVSFTFGPPLREDVGNMRTTLPDSIGRLVAARQMAELAQTLAQKHAAAVSGLWGGSVAAVVAGTLRQLKRPMLLVCGHLDEAEDLADDVELFSGKRPDILPALELAGSLGRVSEEQVSNRLRLIARLASEKDRWTESGVLIASIQALDAIGAIPAATWRTNPSACGRAKAGGGKTDRLVVGTWLQPAGPG